MTPAKEAIRKYASLKMIELLLKNGRGINPFDKIRMFPKDYAKKLGAENMLALRILILWVLIVRAIDSKIII